MPLEQRELGDLLAEELRRLDADQTYAEALAAATGVTGLEETAAARTHVWHDPTEASTPDPALTTS
jgi:ATP-dependent DNA ligase